MFKLAEIPIKTAVSKIDHGKEIIGNIPLAYWKTRTTVDLEVDNAFTEEPDEDAIRQSEQLAQAAIHRSIYGGIREELMEIQVDMMNQRSAEAYTKLNFLINQLCTLRPLSEEDLASLRSEKPTNQQ